MAAIRRVNSSTVSTFVGAQANSMFNRYDIEELDSQRDALDAVTV